MKRPPFAFQMMLTRAEEVRDERRRAYLLSLENWRNQQDTVARQEGVMGELFTQLARQRSEGSQGALEQNHLLYINRERKRLGELIEREKALAREAEISRQDMLKSALQHRVWESLRERFWDDWDAQQRRRTEAELEDWTRSRLKPTRSRAVV